MWKFWPILSKLYSQLEDAIFEHLHMLSHLSEAMLTRSIAKLRICSPLVRTPTLLTSSLFSTSHASVHLLELPRELLHLIFAFLPLPVCGQLCLTSSSVRGQVLAWISSPSFLALAPLCRSRRKNGIRKKRSTGLILIKMERSIRIYLELTVQPE